MTDPVHPSRDPTGGRPTLRGSLAALTLAFVGGYWLSSGVFSEDRRFDLAIGTLFAASAVGMIWRDRGQPISPESRRHRPAVAVLFGLAVLFALVGVGIHRVTS